MLLAVDAGNTDTVVGAFAGEELRAHWRLSTRLDRTADELGVLLRNLFAESGLDPSEIEGMIVSSVVPGLNPVLRRVAPKYFGVPPLFVEPGVKTGIPILYDNPHEVGADRIVNAVAAVASHGSPVLVLDFGTATTLDLVSAAGEYVGGLIAPGLLVSAEALFAKAARLPRVDIVRPPRVVGTNTADSLRSGLFHGYASLVEGIVRRALEEVGDPAPVIATGGLATAFASELDCVTHVDPDLTLRGLQIIWRKNRA